MLGIYFSGTGNTKYVVENLLKLLDENSIAVAMEDESASQKLKEHENIILGYPVYFSDTPKIVKDFIDKNKDSFKNKNVFIVATMAHLSGDGAGVAARVLKKYGAKVDGGLHLRMPDSIADEKAFMRSHEKHKLMICEVDAKIKATAELMMEGKMRQDGLSFVSRVGGLFMQRLWFGRKTHKYVKAPNVGESCVGCGLCVAICPMKNLEIKDQKAVSGSKCTLCYGCVNQCKHKALTIMGKRIHKQHHMKNYL